jgi:hypothetical protein
MRRAAVRLELRDRDALEGAKATLDPLAEEFEAMTDALEAGLVPDVRGHGQGGKSKPV